MGIQVEKTFALKIFLINLKTDFIKFELSMSFCSQDVNLDFPLSRNFARIAIYKLNFKKWQHVCKFQINLFGSVVAETK